MPTPQITIYASTINGEFQEYPRKFVFACRQVIPQFLTVIRNWDANYCIVSKIVFLVKVGDSVLGTTQFKTIQEFDDYYNSQCNCCAPNKYCYLLIDGCYATVDGCKLVYSVNP